GVLVKKFDQALAGSWSADHHPLSTAATAELSEHCLPLLFIDEPVMIPVQPVEHLRRKLAGELILTDLLIFVLIQIGKGRHLKLHALPSAKSAWWRRWLILRGGDCCASCKN